MTTYEDLKDFLLKLDYKLIIASDAETVIHRKFNGEVIAATTAGGVSTAFDPIAKASGAEYIGRGKTEEDKKVLDKKGKIRIETEEGHII